MCYQFQHTKEFTIVLHSLLCFLKSKYLEQIFALKMVFITSNYEHGIASRVEEEERKI